jgi:hypothetical protein
MKKIASILGVSALLLSTNIIAGEAEYKQKKAKGTPGIGYEWKVTLERHDSAEITGSVGGKSSFEPTFDAPDFGWTHTSHWVELELKEEAILTIEMSRQQGIYELAVDRKDPTKQSYKTSGAKLYPALSVYEGWDTTTEKEKGSFSPIQDFWSTIKHKDVVYSAFGETTITYREKLPAGQYSINLGGVNALYCAETDACFNGKHGYRAKFTTSHVPEMKM